MMLLSLLLADQQRSCCFLRNVENHVAGESADSASEGENLILLGSNGGCLYGSSEEYTYLAHIA